MEMKVKVINNKSEGDYIAKVKVKVEMILRWKWKRQWLYNGSENGCTMKAKVQRLYHESAKECESESDCTLKVEMKVIVIIQWKGRWRWLYS